MATVVGEDGARMFCAEEQLLLVALPQHAGIFGSKYVKAGARKELLPKLRKRLRPDRASQNGSFTMD